MWMYTVWGLVSVVGAPKDNAKPDHLLLRFRTQEHVRTFQERFPELEGHQLVATPQADYACQLVVPSHVFAAIATELAEEIDWSSFKRKAEQHSDETGAEHLECLREVWRVTRRMQGEEWD